MKYQSLIISDVAARRNACFDYRAFYCRSPVRNDNIARDNFYRRVGFRAVSNKKQ